MEVSITDWGAGAQGWSGRPRQEFLFPRPSLETSPEQAAPCGPAITASKGQYQISRSAWTASSGKTFPLTFSPSRPLSALSLDAERGCALAVQADHSAQDLLLHSVTGCRRQTSFHFYIQVTEVNVLFKDSPKVPGAKRASHSIAPRTLRDPWQLCPPGIPWNALGLKGPDEGALRDTQGSRSITKTATLLLHPGATGARGNRGCFSVGPRAWDSPGGRASLVHRDVLGLWNFFSAFPIFHLLRDTVLP